MSLSPPFLPLWISATQGGGVPSNTFAPGAAHVDWRNTSMFTLAALTSTGTTVPGGDNGPVVDTPVLLCSLWLRGPQPGVINPATLAGGDIAANIEELTGIPGTTSTEANPGHGVAFDNAAGAGTLRVCTAAAQAYTHGSPPDPTFAGLYQAFTGAGSSEWTHILYALDGTPLGTTLKLMSVCINGIKIGAGGCNVASVPGLYNAHVSNAFGWLIGNINAANTGLATYDIAEVYCNYSSSGGLDNANNIPAATIAKFIDANGKPVFLGAHGELPTGRPAQIYFSASKSDGSPGNAADFVINKGTVTNAFTTANVFDAGFGPGVITAGRARIVAAYGEAIGVGLASPFTTPSTGFAIKAGDLIQLFASLTEPAAPTDHNIQTPAGYSLIKRNGPTANTLNSSMVCQRIAAVDGETTALTFAFTGVTSNRGGQWSIVVIRGADPITPLDAVTVADYGPVVNTTAFGTPAITSIAPNCLLVNYISAWSGGETMTVIAGETRQYTNTGNAPLVQHWEQLGAAGLVLAKSSTSSTPDGGTGYSITIKPA